MSIDRRGFLAALPVAAGALSHPAPGAVGPTDPLDMPLRKFLAPVRYCLSGEALDWRTNRLVLLLIAGGTLSEWRRNLRPCNACGHADYEYRWTVTAWPGPTTSDWFCVCGCAVDIDPTTLNDIANARFLPPRAP